MRRRRSLGRRAAGGLLFATALALGASVLPGAPLSAAEAAPLRAGAAADAAAVTGADEPGKVVRAPAAASDRLTLARHMIPVSSQQALDDNFTNVGVHTIVNTTNHQLHPTSGGDCAVSEQDARPTAPVVSTGSTYCWDAGDAATQGWSPQGMTSSGDADADGKWGDDRVIVSGWGTANTTKDEDVMGRMAFINATEGSAQRNHYRWVLPVIPTDGGTDFARFGSHMGGMVWWGDKLIVTASLGGEKEHHNALYVFSTKHMYQANTNASWIGKRGSEVSARGYQYFMPAIGSYSVDDVCKASSDANRIPCFDGLSMDHSTTPYSLVANEFVTTGAAGYHSSRIWRYNLAPTDKNLPLSADSAGNSRPTDVYDTGIPGMQGTLNQTENGENVIYSANSLWGPKVHGVPWRLPLPAEGQATAVHASTSTNGSATAQRTWAQHSEGMTYMDDLDQVWSQTEWAADSKGDWPTSNPVRERVVFSLPMSDVRGALNP